MNFIINCLLYLIPSILIITIINILLSNKKLNSNYKYLINGICLILIPLIINNYIDTIIGIFTFKYLSVKLYIIILLITNIITLITLKKELNLIYKIINYLLYGLMTTILVIIISILVMIKSEIVSLSIDNTIILLNISIIIFISYLILISIIYIVKNYLTKKEKVNILSSEELLSISNKNQFYINGVECSIIFEDSVKENIIKNYHILLNNIDAKLVNGYTLEENRILKSICTKLKTTNLQQIDINNSSILTKITIEEYNLLKQIYNEQRTNKI